MNSGVLAAFCGQHTKLLIQTPNRRKGSTRVEYAAVRIPNAVPRTPMQVLHFYFTVHGCVSRLYDCCQVPEEFDDLGVGASLRQKPLRLFDVIEGGRATGCLAAFNPQESVLI